MRFSIEAWAPEYGNAVDAVAMAPSDAQVHLDVERPPSRWSPVTPPANVDVETILFTDGVRRVDARVWINSDEGSRPAMCASYSAGAVRCDGRATIVAVDVQRGLFCAPCKDAGAISTRYASYPIRNAPGDSAEDLALALQQHMGALEVGLASAERADLTVIDGPLTGRQSIPGAVGYVKTHHVSYLPSELVGVVGRLDAGQRTPLFMTASSWSRFSWYLRLPGPRGHPWAGVVRCESSGDVEVKEAVALADKVTSVLPRYASASHKDPRAPQNLYPIAGLERELRRRLGDPNVLYRGLRIAAAA
jgi:hypothetical protein